MISQQSKESNKVAVLGCGWLGLPLAQCLLFNRYEVIGTTTTVAKLSSLSQLGIEARLLELDKDFSLEQISDASIWVLAFPPKTKTTNGEWYIKAVSRIAKSARESGVKKLVLLSSTSVYPDGEGVMYEGLRFTESYVGNKTIWRAEEEILKSQVDQIYVLRLGGLAGEGRVLAKHFSGKENLANGDSPTNLLHGKDAVASILFFIEKMPQTGIYNVCSPEHPSRKDVFTNDCLRLGLDVPRFLAGGVRRIISVEKLQNLGFSFEYPNPLGYFYS